MPGCVQDFNRDLVQGFFWVLLEALGILLGLDFWLHSIMPVTWNPKYPPWELTASSRTCIHFLTQTPLRGWGLYAPWKSLKVLENCSRHWKVLKFQLLKQFKENCKGKGANRKTFGIKFPDVEELKIDIDVFSQRIYMTVVMWAANQWFMYQSIPKLPICNSHISHYWAILKK